MPNIIILYRIPGSCGDLVQSLLLDDTSRYKGVISQFETTSAGRVNPTLNPNFKKNFDHPPHRWYSRTWTDADCVALTEIIKESDVDNFVIPTQQIDQLIFLKKYVSNSVSIGITYPENMFPIVLKNWCKKVAPSDVNFHNNFNQPLHQYLKKKNVFGEFIMSEHLKIETPYTPCVQTSVSNSFDIEIPLENLYVGDVSIFTKLVSNTANVSNKLCAWLTAQSKLHQFCFLMHPILKQSLGFNSKAITTSDLDIELDTFDNILIKQYCITNKLFAQVPNFKSLKQANDFFGTEANI